MINGNLRDLQCSGKDVTLCAEALQASGQSGAGIRPFQKPPGEILLYVVGDLHPLPQAEPGRKQLRIAQVAEGRARLPGRKLTRLAVFGEGCDVVC